MASPSSPPTEIPKTPTLEAEDERLATEAVEVFNASQQRQEQESGDEEESGEIGAIEDLHNR